HSRPTGREDENVRALLRARRVALVRSRARGELARLLGAGSSRPRGREATPAFERARRPPRGPGGSASRRAWIAPGWGSRRGGRRGGPAHRHRGALVAGEAARSRHPSAGVAWTGAPRAAVAPGLLWRRSARTGAEDAGA